MGQQIVNIDPRNFDFSKIKPDHELNKHNAYKWFNERFSELGIYDYDMRIELVDILYKIGVINLTINEVYPHNDPRYDDEDGRYGDKGKFYFWNEVWSELIGPFDTLEERDKALDEYARNL